MKFLTFAMSPCAAAALFALCTNPAFAANPEQVQDLGPKKGETSVQYIAQLAVDRQVEQRTIADITILIEHESHRPNLFGL